MTREAYGNIVEFVLKFISSRMATETKRKFSCILFVISNGSFLMRSARNQKSMVDTYCSFQDLRQFKILKTNYQHFVWFVILDWIIKVFYSF